jgi:thiol-disulfide isomerase/thioredoxin
MIFFYAPWCGNCKKGKLEFEKVMRIAEGEAHMIDYNANPDIARKYDIKCFRYYQVLPKRSQKW